MSPHRSFSNASLHGAMPEQLRCYKGRVPRAYAEVDTRSKCNCRNYMKLIELKITRIGNSHGVRLPAATLKRYGIGIGRVVVMEQRSDGIFLRPTSPAIEKLSWEDTAREMDAAGEDWSDWDCVTADGLTEIPWKVTRTRHVAEPKPSYANRKKKKRP